MAMVARAEIPEAVVARIDSSAVKTIDRFIKNAPFEPPKIVSFPLHGLDEIGPTALTGNS
jgi:hypothetical protein